MAHRKYPLFLSLIIITLLAAGIVFIFQSGKNVMTENQSTAPASDESTFVPPLQENENTTVKPAATQEAAKESAQSAETAETESPPAEDTFPPQSISVVASGSPITVEFDGSGAAPAVISIKRDTTQVIILKAKENSPPEGIAFLDTQGGFLTPIKPGESLTVTVTPRRTFFYWPHTADHKNRYPFTINIKIYY
jgi:hypothetical protein